MVESYSVPMDGEISHYSIIEKLGQGGMGIVYKAEDTRLKRTVALKFLSQDLTTEHENKELFIREARAASSLQHQNVCTIHEIDESSGGQLFISMDYYEGESLKHKISKGHLPFSTALDYAIQITEGLAEAHKKGIIHRDIKPGNIMVTTDGIVKILDFGLAKVSGTESLTKSGKFMGTVAYSSPEQVQGKKTDHLTDIWSLGVVLYEISTRQLPFDHEHEAAIIYSIIDKSPEPPTELQDDIPAELERIIYKCLKKAKEERYQSAELLLSDLINFKAVLEGKGHADRKKVPDSRREAERRQATILYAEISGYHEMMERMDEEETNSIMNLCVERILSVARQHGGTLNRISSNNFMIFFGIPIAAEDAPKQAVNTGIRLRNMLQQFNKTENISVQFSPKIGINTGTVITDSVMGNDKKKPYVTGDCVEFAVQLKDLSASGQILVGASTFKYTRDEFDYQLYRSITPKSTKEQASVYELHSVEEKIHRVRLGAERMIYAEMVGREKELDKLQYHLSMVIDGKGSIVNVIGEAGIGKSRLMAELRKKIEITRITLLEGRALSNGTNLSFHPIVDIIRNLAGIKDNDNVKEAFYKVEKTIENIYPEGSSEVFPFVATMMGMKLSGKYEERVKGIEGEALEKMILKNLRELFTKAAGQNPMVIVIEDLHWADLSSVELLGLLYRLAENNRILFINVFRPDYKETGDRILTTIKNRYEKYHTEIYLESLNEQLSEKLVNSLLKIKVLPTKINKLITERTEGNPFFIEEVVSSFIDEGAVVIEDGKFQVSEKIESVVIPETIDELLMARIDKLDENTRTLIKFASVIGRNFFYRILYEVAKKIDGIDEKLIHLKEAQLILERKRMEEVEYLFKHALVQQTVYSTLLMKQRKHVHSTVAHAFETVFQERLHEFYGTLAFHFSLAEELDKAEKYLILAGEKALKSSASSEAINYYKEALAIYKKKYGDATDPKKIAMLEKYIGIALFNKGHFIDAAEFFDRVLSYYNMKIPKHPVLSAVKFIYAFISLIVKIYFPSLMGYKIPTEDELEIFDLIKKKAMSLSITDSKRFVIELISYSTWYTKYDIRNSDFMLWTATIFSYGGISFKMADKLFDYNEKRLNKNDPNSMFAFISFRNNHNLLTGNWNKEQFDENFINLGFDTGNIQEALTYLAFLAHIHLERGDRTAEQMLKRLIDLADSYENDYGRLAKFSHGILYLLKFREFNQAIRRSEEGINFIRKNLGNKPGLLMVYSLKIRIQILLGDIKDACETMQIADELASSDTYTPYFLTFYATTRFIMNLHQLQEAFKNGNKLQFKRNKSSTLKSGKKAVKVCSQAAYERTETYRLMGVYYWLTDKQKNAVKWWEKSILEAEKMGARLELSRTYLEVGRRLSETKSKFQKLYGIDANTYLKKARILFEEMDLQWDLKELDKMF